MCSLSSDANGEQELDGDFVRGLRERVAGPRLALRAVAELWDVVGRSGSQAVRPMPHTTQHIPGTVPGNEGKQQQKKPDGSS